jgi:adenylate cyclase
MHPTDADYADRRPVTVLFADLTGFTSLSERLDPEDVRSLQSELYDELRAALARFGGFMEKYVGDAVMAVFGAPVAHEDDPERALRAAIEMHERVAVVSTGWERRLGRALTLHIGVNTGRVVAGTLGSQDGAYAVTGDTVNTTARLQSAAAPGETLVSRATYLLTHHVFAFEPRGTVALKGKVEPVPVYRLIGIAEHPRSARGLEAHGLNAPLVGRDSELAQMLDTFRLALEGRAQVVSLIGEAGAGKSRLVDAFVQRLHRLPNTSALTIRHDICSSLGVEPYGVIASFIRQGYGVAPTDPVDIAQRKIEEGLRNLGMLAEDAAGVAPMSGYVLGLQSVERVRDIEPDRLNRQILLLVRTVLERRLDQGPLLLIVEDLHWADHASIQGMRVLVDSLVDRPLMLLFTYRPSFDGRALALSRVQHTALHLPPLGEGDVAAILQSFFGAAAETCISGALRELILRRAGGNPFYLEEILRGLIADGILVSGTEGWKAGGHPSLVDVPPTIEGLLLSRIDRLPAPHRRCLHEAAVLGPVFDPALLRQIATEPIEDGVFERLREADLLEPMPGMSGTDSTLHERSYRFSHALVHEVVYRNLLLSKRTELHGRAGRVLETLHGPHPERLEDLALLGHHFGLSEDRRRGARYLCAAADWARGIYANDDAIRHYARTLGILRECEACEDDLLDVHERLGDLLAPLGRAPEAFEHYQTVRSAAACAGDDTRQARICRKLGGLHWAAGERQQGLALFQAGLALLEGRTEDIELAHLYQEMGRLAFRSGDNVGAVGWAQRALAQAERATARAGNESPEARHEAAAAIAHALNTLGSALARLNRTDEAVEHIERSVAVAESEGLLQAACRSYANLGVLYANLNPGLAVETCLTGLETARKIGDLGFQSRLYANLAVAYCALTDRCDAEGLKAAQAAIDLDRRLGQRDHLAVPLIVLGQIHQCHGDLGVAMRYYREALAIAEETREPQLLFPCYDGIATVHLDQGNHAEAERYLIQAQGVSERAGLDRDSLVVLPFLC